MSPSLSIKLPIFSIHGNHDDPTGLDMLSSLDQACINHYLNYFGKVKNVEKIEVTPVLFERGQTRIALYGIGHIKDERLNLAFEQKAIKFKRPLQNTDSWFNILVLHQNKYKGVMNGASRRCSLMESQFPSFFDLVIWAHEHECIPNVYECAENGVHFLQPGSTVITSLCEAETKPKCAFLLKVKGQSFTSKALKIRSTRTFVHRTIDLKGSLLKPERLELIEKYVKEALDTVILQAEKERDESWKSRSVKLDPD